MEYDVLVENQMKNQISFFGRIPRMTSVIFSSSNCNPGDIVRVKILSSNQNNLFGEHVIGKTKAA